MFVLDLFNTKYEKELREGAVDKVVSEGGPYDLPGKDYPRPGDAPRRPRSSGGTTPRRHDDDPDFMDPDQRRLRAEQERLKKAWAEKNKGMAEEYTRGAWKDEALDYKDFADLAYEKLTGAYGDKRRGIAQHYSRLENRTFGSTINQHGYTQLLIDLYKKANRDFTNPQDDTDTLSGTGFGHVSQREQGVAEEHKPYGDYQQSPRAFGVGNFQRIVRANMGNLPTVTLEFADPNDNIVLDKKGVDLISDYYDGLKTDAIKNHFIYRVLPSADEVLTVLKKLGWNQAVQPELPGIPRQGELPLQEKKKFNPNSDVAAGDVKVARELQKLRAQYPAAKSDVEAVAKAEIDSSERSQQQLSAIKGANTEQDRLLQQLVDLDRKQGKEIGSLDNENDRLEQQLAHVDQTNARLAQAIGQMSGRAQSSSTGASQARVIDMLPNSPADNSTDTSTQPATTLEPSEPREPRQKSKSDAMSRMAQSLGNQTRKVQGINSNPPPASIRFNEPSNVTDISQHRANLVKQAQAAIKNKDLKPLAKQLVNKGVVTRTGTDEGLLDFVTKKQPATKTKPEPVDPMIAKIVSNRQNPQSRVPRAKAKVYHGYDEYNRAKAVGDVEESTVNEFAPAGGGGSGNYFKELASAWYNGTFNTGSLQKGIKSQQDVERLLNRGIVCPDGKTRKLHIDYNSDFDGVEIYSDDYYEHGDLDGNDGRTGQPWGPYDFMAFSDEQLDEGAPISTTSNSIDSGGAVDNFRQQMANNTELAYQKGMAEGTDDPFGPQGRFVGDTGPTQITKTVPRVQLRIGDPVLYKPTEQRATIEALSKDGTKARIHISSPMGGRIFNCMVADLKALGALKGNINELSTDKLAQYKTAAALDAGAADKRGDYERGDKRFAGIVKATKKQFANDLKKHGQQGVAEGSSTSSDAVERAILNRIMTQHTDLLMRFGPDKVMQAAEEVAYNVGDVDEIGTSDVSAYVNQVRQILGA